MHVSDSARSTHRRSVLDVLTNGLCGIVARVSNPDRARLLRLFLQSWRVPGVSEVAVGSDSGREALAFWFDVQTAADSKINQICQNFYDARHPKHYLWTEHTRFLFDGVRDGDRVLDIGCGASFYPQWIAKKAECVVCVDINPGRVELAVRNNRSDNVRYEVLDVTKDLPPGRFDVAICSHVLEHLDDPEAMLQALARSVPRLLVKVPLEDSHWTKLVKRDIGVFWMDDADHRREYTEPLLRAQLEASGFRVNELVRGYDLRAAAVSEVCQPGAHVPAERATDEDDLRAR